MQLILGHNIETFQELLLSCRKSSNKRFHFTRLNKGKHNNHNKWVKQVNQRIHWPEVTAIAKKIKKKLINLANN